MALILCAIAKSSQMIKIRLSGRIWNQHVMLQTMRLFLGSLEYVSSVIMSTLDLATYLYKIQRIESEKSVNVMALRPQPQGLQ